MFEFFTMLRACDVSIVIDETCKNIGNAPRLIWNMVHSTSGNKNGLRPNTLLVKTVY